MKILVTGGNGFIGSNFINYLFTDHGKEINLLTNIDKMTSVAGTWIDEMYGEFAFYQKIEGDICDIEKFNEEMAPCYDLCVHFAAESHVDKSLDDVAPFIKTNVNGTLAMAAYCARKGIPMIHMSTDEVYGHLESLDDSKFTVDSPLAPRNPYAASKASAELMLRAYANTEPNFEYYIVRGANNYGPHQDETKFLPKLIKYLDEGKAFPMYGKGDFYREWTWVRDTAKGIMKLYDSLPLENGITINISSGELESNFNVAMMVTDVMRNIRPDVEANIKFIKDPRGKAHDKIYAIAENILGDRYVRLNSGLIGVVESYFEDKG